MGKTVPRFHKDNIIRNIHFGFEFVHLKLNTKLSDREKTVPRFHMDYIIRNIRFHFN